MKKILAIALSVVMVLGLATSALAVSWAAPAASSSASPFAIEVVKLGVNADVTGAKYYTVLTDAAAYDFSTIYFAIKLSVPSYANANSYYGNSGFLSGSKVKVTINYTNVSGKSNETYYVQLTDAAQTLWYNGKGFDAEWTASLNNNCGCGNNHILSAVASGNKEVSIKACVGAAGELKDIKIDGCYGVAEKTYYGVVPCVNCSPVNLSGFLFSGDCATYKVFFSTNAAGKVTGVYAVDGNYKSAVGWALVDFNKALYGWKPEGVISSDGCSTCHKIQAFELTQLPQGTVVNFSSYQVFTRPDSWKVKDAAGNDITTTAFDAWVAAAKKDASKTVVDRLYYEKDSNKANLVTGWDDIKPSGAPTSVTKWYWSDELTGTTGNTGSSGSVVGTMDVEGNLKKVEGYEYISSASVQYLKTKYVMNSEADSNSRLYKQTSATTVSCDSNEASYINALNHMYALLGFTYADVAAGNVYMTKDILLANFGFSTSVCDTKVWGAYTAAITVANVAEVPATGSVTYVGFAMIVLAIAAAVVTKKVRA